jgi:hypothetical protein
MVTYTADASNSATCPEADKLSGDEEVDPTDTDSPEGCDQTTDGCTMKTHCSLSSTGGSTTTLDEEATTPSNGATSFSGTITVVTTGGGVDMQCTYTLTAVKK